MLQSLTILALADVVGDVLMVLLAAVVFALMWLTIEVLERV
jgi:hypothetical protein